ncbi:nucleoside deaminase [Streptomyces sp. SID13031]|uniref:nucleoside deaminase n=1 Tax=Streptomyces sp. SID13031 TaxID=2706046 RepID=UPI0013CD65AD|nr:nucleoside deaminase [Streptomyces sp. SID13031]NEA35268.1 nucleoside deaminase [Streptomyces sp. SID13031]
MASIWQQPFELAWEALGVGSFPVGAVLVDPDGQIVLAGRNRRADEAGLLGQISGAAIAHAEINLLAQLGHGDYRDWTLRSSLQPCLLCLSAVRVGGVGHVSYAGADPLWDGCAQVPALLPELLSSRWPTTTGPAEGMDGVWGALLPAIWYVVHKPESVAEPTDLLPWATVQLARGCVTTGILDAPSGTDAYSLASALHHRG